MVEVIPGGRNKVTLGDDNHCIRPYAVALSEP